MTDTETDRSDNLSASMNAKPAKDPGAIMVKNPWGCLGAVAIGLLMGILLLIATCSKLDEHHAPSNLIPSDAIYSAAAEKLVRRQLRDPDSATFSDVIVAYPNSNGDTIVCGMVNAKNGFGGMVGRKRFIVGRTVILKGPDDVVLEERVGKELMDLEWAKSC